MKVRAAVEPPRPSVVHDFTFDVGKHRVVMVKQLTDGRAFIMATGNGVNAGDSVIVRLDDPQRTRARYRIESLQTLDEAAWRAYAARDDLGHRDP